MALRYTPHLPFLPLAIAVISLAYVHGVQAKPFRRSSFPAGFVFGTASAAYQYEGAAKEGGRGPSVWDVYTHKYPNRIKDGSSGDVAIDFYHKYKEDVKLMKEMGLDAFRLSISWSRVLPKGRLSGGVNKAGIKYYNNLINELLSNGIKPFITLFHWDTPQTFEGQFGGFLSPKIVPHFRDFAEVCFKEFGDRVKHWITLNEPWSYSVGGYALGMQAPGRCSPWVGNCTGGDSATEPYLVAHHLLLSHAAAVKIYKDKYQASQKGLIGITLVSHWMMPVSSSPANAGAARRALDFMYGWYMDPLTKGKYPSSMTSLVGSRLPKFTKEQSDLLKASFDFIGLNYYTTNYASDAPPISSNTLSYSTDSRSNLSGVRNGVPIGPQAASSWLYIYPQGMKEVLMYTKNKYGNPLVYITENGVSEYNNASWTLKEALQDDMRRDYHHHHLQQVQLAIKDGANVKGYFAWSLLDNFEWGDGYTIRFGINYVDYKNGLKRYRKKSSYWFENFLKG